MRADLPTKVEEGGSEKNNSGFLLLKCFKRHKKSLYDKPSEVKDVHKTERNYFKKFDF